MAHRTEYGFTKDINLWCPIVDDFRGILLEELEMGRLLITKLIS